MGTVEHAVNYIENRNKLTGAEFDLAQVKKMSSWRLFDKCRVPIYQGRIMNKVENSKTWISLLFPVNDGRNIGQLNFAYSKGSHWNLTMNLEDLEQEGGKKMESSELTSSYFVVKYKYNVDANSLGDGDFCKQIMVFGTSKNKASVSWSCNAENLHSILLQVYQVPANIPNFFLTPNNNMILGKIEKFNETRKAENAARILRGHSCFIFGSTERQMTVSFLTNQKMRKDCPLGLTVTLHVVSEEEQLVPFVLTFTIFSERKSKMDDLLKKMVVRRGHKEFHQSTSLAFYAELHNMMVNETLYYKVVLEPL